MDIRQKIKAAQSKVNQASQTVPAKRMGKTERRKFQRFELACPVVLYRDAGKTQSAWVRSRSDNISNGGCFVTVMQTADIEPNSLIRLDLKIPRQTPNTYMLEPHQIDAYIVRVEPGRDTISSVSANEKLTELGLALKFAEPLELSLE